MSELGGEYQRSPAEKLIRRHRAKFENLSDQPSQLKDILADIDLKILAQTAEREFAKSRVARRGANKPFDFKKVYFSPWYIRFVDGNYSHTDIHKEAAIADIPTSTIYFESRNFKSFEDRVAAKYFPSLVPAVEPGNPNYAKEHEILTRTLFMLVLCHEFAHHVTQGWREKRNDEHKIVVLSGVHRQEIEVDADGREVGFKDNRMAGLKEVITNNLELDLALEYLRNASIPGVSEESLRAVHNAMNEEDEYRKKDIEIFNNFISTLADKSNLPPDTVWGGFKEAYFSNRNISAVLKQMKDLTGVDIREETMTGTDAFIMLLRSAMRGGE